MSFQERNIATLPAEILSEICDYFAETVLLQYASLNPIPTFPPTKHSHDDRQVLQNLRLTCRSLHDAATAKLFHLMEIEFNQKSLSAADELSRSPRIAPVVKGVRVVLRYCPALVAATATSFKSFKDKFLSDIEGKLFRQLGGDELRPDETKKIKRALDAYSTIRFAWKESRVPGEPTEKLEYYEEIANRAYQCFKSRQEEQQQLVDDGSFAASIGIIISRLPIARSLNIADNFTRKSLQREIGSQQEIAWLTEEENIVEVLASDMRWKDVDQTEELEEIMPARLLTDIPLEIYKNGIELQEFQLDVFPEKKGYSLLAAEPDFHLAFSKLQSFRFGHLGMNHLRVRLQPLAGEDLSYIEQYLGACISATSLREIELRFYNFRTHNGQMDDGGQPINARDLLNQLHSSELEMVNISDLTATQDAVEHLANSIGNTASFLRMSNIKIPSGSWAKILDILHTKLANHCVEGRCDAHVLKLYGGEFPEDKKPEGDLFDWMESDDEEDSDVIVNADDYINGRRSDNPVGK